MEEQMEEIKATATTDILYFNCIMYNYGDDHINMDNSHRIEILKKYYKFIFDKLQASGGIIEGIYGRIINAYWVIDREDFYSILCSVLGISLHLKQSWHDIDDSEISYISVGFELTTAYYMKFGNDKFTVDSFIGERINFCREVCNSPEIYGQYNLVVGERANKHITSEKFKTKFPLYQELSSEKLESKIHGLDAYFLYL